MSFREMMELLEKIKLEHVGFNLDIESGRYDMWHKKFGHLDQEQFARLCMGVLENTRFTPTFADFAKVHKELFGANAKPEIELDPKFEHDYDQMIENNGQVKKTDGKKFWYERKSPLDAALKSCGHEWFNEYHQLTTASDCMSMVRALTTDRRFNAKYIDWKSKL